MLEVPSQKHATQSNMLQKHTGSIRNYETHTIEPPCAWFASGYFTKVIQYTFHYHLLRCACKLVEKMK